VLHLMSQNFAWDTAIPAGTMELVRQGGETVECDLVLMNEWQRKLPGFLAPANE
jgi:type III restriction enzyme